MGLVGQILYVVFLPIRWLLYFLVFKAFHYVFQTLGFIIGLLGGLVAGYFFFIHKLPLTVEEPEFKELVPEGKQLDDATLERYYSYLPPWVSNPDYERIDWLNKILAEMWPYLGKAICAQVLEQAGPLLKQNKPAFLDSLEFEELSLGSIPPAVIAMKTFDTKDEEVILQPVLRWAANPNIMVAAKFKGIKGTVQIIDLSLTAVARITLKPLIPVFPCFSTITVSLMEKPTVDFGLKVLGLDVMAIPGLYTFVQKTIGDVVAGMYLWPKVLEVYDDQPLPPIGWLEVTNLRVTSRLSNKAGLLDKSDPYLRLSLDRHTLGRRATTVKHHNLTPDWGAEELLLRVADTDKQKLSIEVFDKSCSGKSDTRMSVGEVELKGVHEDGFTRIDVRLVEKFADLEPPAEGAPAASSSKKTKDLGTLSLDVKLRKFAEGEGDLSALASDEDIEVFPSWLKVGGGRLRIFVHQGEGLEGKNHANPYVLMRFRNQEWTSKHYKKSPEVTFDDDPWEILLDEPPVTDTLSVKVYSKNLSSLSSLVSSKEVIGFLELRLKDVVANGRINDIYNLTDSKSGKIKIEMQWHTRLESSVVVEEARPSGGK